MDVMKIILRPITENDGNLIVKWRNSPEVASHCLNQRPISLESHKKFYKDNVLTGKYVQYIVERVEEDFGVASYPIATVYLKDIDRFNRRCELCIFTSNDEEWNTESQAIALRMLLNKAFGELYMHKIYSYVFYKYIDEADLLKKVGFSTEAVLKNEVIDINGNYNDIVRFAITESELKDME